MAAELDLCHRLLCDGGFCALSLSHLSGSGGSNSREPFPDGERIRHQRIWGGVTGSHARVTRVGDRARELGGIWEFMAGRHICECNDRGLSGISRGESMAHPVRHDTAEFQGNGVQKMAMFHSPSWNCDLLYLSTRTLNETCIFPTGGRILWSMELLCWLLMGEAKIAQTKPNLLIFESFHKEW